MDKLITVKNINPKFGDSIEFESLNHLKCAILACGYALPFDGLKEGRDYENVERIERIERA